jgi:hypothetical protein
VRDGFANELGQSVGFDVLDNPRDDVALAPHGADNDCLVANASRLLKKSLASRIVM